MRKVFSLFVFCFFILGALSCFAQNKTTINRIGIWREDLSCRGLELGQVIRTYRNNAVFILQDCCKKHKSACLDTYSSPDNKTLLYTAIETKSYDVAIFLFNLSGNYRQNIDAYGLTKDYVNETPYLNIIETQGNPTSKTPLMLACYNGDLTGTKLLLDYGASLLKENYTKEGKINKNAYEYAKIAPHKDQGFMEFVQKEYKKQSVLYGENKTSKQNNFGQDFESLALIQEQSY